MTYISRGNLTGRSILIVEDEPLVALDFRYFLMEWGCQVLGPVSSVAAALALIKNEMPDAALLDINLHGERSDQVAEALAAAGRPFVVTTGYALGQAGAAMAAAPVVSKPFRPEKLQSALVEVLTEPGSLGAGGGRAERFLMAWVAGHLRVPHFASNAGTSRLLAKLLVDAKQAGIPGSDLLRSAGGDLLRFIDEGLGQR